MINNFHVKNGWLGTERQGIYYFYNAVDKEFAVFKPQENLDKIIESKLKAINIIPEPDFICEANAAAVTLTTKCNMECPYCYVKPAGGLGVMSVEMVRNAVKALAKQTEKELIIFGWGGEPTQNPVALIAMLEEAQKYPYIKVCLVTNGVMDSTLLNKLLKFKNLVFQISFDGLINHNKQKPLLTESNSLSSMLNSMETISLVSRRVALRATVTKNNVHELNTCLLPTVSQYTNRLMLEHLHTFNGRAVSLKDVAPSVEDYVNLVFNLIPIAEAKGIHVKVLPLDHLRAGGPNNKMNFLNILSNGEIVVSNAIIHHLHQDFDNLQIGHLDNDNILFNKNKNELLSKRYLDNYQMQCKDCFARTICRGSVQRYLFISNDALNEWDNLRCQYFMAIIERWIQELTNSIYDTIKFYDNKEGYIQLVAPDGKIHYPMLVMENGLSLSFKQFV
ncbi:MAG: radical SAM protein [Chlorobium sp.]|nr:MAG: radical SAM protein [Chlorobium sp.]